MLVSSDMTFNRRIWSHQTNCKRSLAWVLFAYVSMHFFNQKSFVEGCDTPYNGASHSFGDFGMVNVGDHYMPHIQFNSFPVLQSTLFNVHNPIFPTIHSSIYDSFPQLVEDHFQLQDKIFRVYEHHKKKFKDPHKAEFDGDSDGTLNFTWRLCLLEKLNYLHSLVKFRKQTREAQNDFRPSENFCTRFQTFQNYSGNQDHEDVLKIFKFSSGDEIHTLQDLFVHTNQNWDTLSGEGQSHHVQCRHTIQSLIPFPVG